MFCTAFQDNYNTSHELSTLNLHYIMLYYSYVEYIQKQIFVNDIYFTRKLHHDNIQIQTE